MKTKILDFLKNLPENKTEQYNQAVYFLSLSSKNINLVKAYNSRIFTDKNLEILLYDLKKENEISDSDIINHSIIQNEEKKGIIQVNANLEPLINSVNEMQEKEKEGLKLFANYPFLREKDCPNELKILVNDAITAFYSYKEKHQQLWDEVTNNQEPQLTKAEIFDIASELLKDFQLNRQIYDELEYYKVHGSFLMEHEIFADMKKDEEQNSLSPADLAKQIRNIAPRISKEKKKLAKATKAEKIEINQKIKDLEAERVELQKLLDAK